MNAITAFSTAERCAKTASALSAYAATNSASRQLKIGVTATVLASRSMRYMWRSLTNSDWSSASCFSRRSAV